MKTDLIGCFCRFAWLIVYFRVLIQGNLIVILGFGYMEGRRKRRWKVRERFVLHQKERKT